MENICQSLGKNSDKMAKGPFKSADFDGNGEFGKNRPALAISQRAMANVVPFESGGFDENGIFGENCENRQALDISQREMANVVPFVRGGFDENGIFGEHSPSS